MPNIKSSISPLLTTFVILMALLLAACSENAPERKLKVGRDYLKYSDDTRESWNSNDARPLITTIWYPTMSTAKEKLWQVAIFNAGWSALGSPILEPKQPYPLVVLSHGTGGAAMQMSWFAEHLASNGYIVAAVNHHGNTAAEDALLPQGFALWWERARDLSVVIDKLLVDDRFARFIDPKRIALAGFSLGGYSVVSSVGGITDLSKKNEFCSRNSDNPICVLPPEAGMTMAEAVTVLEADAKATASFERSGKSYKDARVKAVFAIAPVHGPAFTAESLKEVDIPVSFVVGSHDKQARAEDNAKLLADSINNSTFEELKDVSHYTFLSRCNKRGQQFVPELCGDNKNIIRANVHKSVSEKARLFFEKHL